MAAHPVPLLDAACRHAGRTAVTEDTTLGSLSVTYGQILQATSALVERLAPTFAAGNRACILTQPGVDYVVSTYAVWAMGGAAVPLCATHSATEMEYYVQDSESPLLLHDAGFTDRAKELKALCPGLSTVLIERRVEERAADGSKKLLPDPPQALTVDSDALFIYTSGTTGKPKGVVHSHASIEAMVDMLVQSWGWVQDDVILNCLPLHHIHGLVNITYCALRVGATVEFMKFSSKRCLDRLAAPQRLTVFMAVPTIYSYLLKTLDGLPSSEKEAWSHAVKNRKFRLCVSGSAALPPIIEEQWMKAAGTILLERYGMTETGMILSQIVGQPITGAVGNPLPTVEVKLRSLKAEGDGEEGTFSIGGGRSTSDFSDFGELLVRGPALFKRYHNKEKATKESFTEDGWFITGDTVGRLAAAPHYYCILGRTSVDIIKSAGYKLSAFEIEDSLLKVPGVAECAVVGLPDSALGQRVAAVVAAQDGHELDEKAMTAWLESRLAAYKRPKEYRFVKQIPRNAMGKVNKKELVLSLFGSKL